MGNSFRVRIMQCGKKNVDVIDIIQQRDVKVDPTFFSKAILGRSNAPAAKRIRELTEEIVSGWEKEQGRV